MKNLPFPKFLRPAFFICMGLCFTNMASSPAPEVFIGSSPCDPVMRPWMSIPSNTDCEFIKWKLLLFKNPENNQQQRFNLTYTYGVSKPGTQGFLNGGSNAEMTGNWRVLNNCVNLPGKSMIQLKDQKIKTPLTFLKLNNSLLHLTDQEGHLMIGNAGWSYTLNKMQND